MPRTYTPEISNRQGADNCGNCNAFRPFRNGDGGVCAARAPMPDLSPSVDASFSAKTQWPWVAASDWCREHGAMVATPPQGGGQ